MGLVNMIGKQVLKRASGGRLQPQGRIQALRRLPTLLRLSYALLRDPRVPLWQRASVIGAVGLIFSPVDVVGDLPVIGQFWDFTLAVTVLDVFIKWAPAEVVNEHITKLGLTNKIPLRKI